MQVIWCFVIWFNMCMYILNHSILSHNSKVKIKVIKVLFNYYKPLQEIEKHWKRHQHASNRKKVYNCYIHWKLSCEYCWHISLHWRHISFIHIHTSCIFNHNRIAHAESHKRWTAAAYKFRRWTWKCSHDFSILFHSNYFIRITYISKITGICIFALKMKKSFILRIILSLFLYIYEETMGRNDSIIHSL